VLLKSPKPCKGSLGKVVLHPSFWEGLGLLVCPEKGSEQTVHKLFIYIDPVGV
jgi:hypothetical protein